MVVSIPTLAATNSTLAPFSWELLRQDAGRLMPLALIVIGVVVIAGLVWFFKKMEEPEPVKRSKKRGL